MNSKRDIALVTSLLMLGATICCKGCSKRDSATGTGPVMAAPPKRHEHHPPHGGTPIVLGDEQFHLELVLEASSGTLRAFVLDGELDKFIRIAAPALEFKVVRGNRTEVLKLKAIADPATGETVGDTSMFEGKAEWLKQVTHFHAVISTIQIRNQRYQQVAFDFPEGNDKDEK